MAVRPVLSIGHPVLRQSSRTLTDDEIASPHVQHLIDDLRLVPGDNGVFDVTVDGDLIYSKAQTGRHAEPGEVLELFTDLIGSDVPRYGEE